MVHITKLFLLALCIGFAAGAAGQSTNAASERKPADTRKVESTGSAAKDLLGELWTKLRSYGPRQQSGPGRQYATVTIGIRGAENTESELKPYWKEGDPGFAEEVKAFSAAQELAEKNRMREAVQAFEAFLKAYPNSMLKPNAQFALGLSHTALGDKSQATTVLKGFIQDHPKHPLVADANRALEQLNKL